MIHGTQRAVLGDEESVRGVLLEFEEIALAVDRKWFAVDLRILESWIAASDGNWEQVIRLAAPIAEGGPEPLLAGRLPVRWLVAKAHERMGELEEAAALMETVLSPTRLASFFMEFHMIQRAVYEAFAHHRLVLLYSRMGRVEDARRHWEIFEKTFTNPDPELVPMIEEARQALAEAETKM
jgi:hypothetical protein